MNHIRYSFIFMALVLFSSVLMGQQEELKAKGVNKAMSMDAMRVANSQETGTVDIPEALGGGEMVAHSLTISGTNMRGGISLDPSDFGAENLLPGQWITNEYFLFVATDAVDIKDFYLYHAPTDKAYVCDFEVGEALGYEEIEEGKEVTLSISDDRVVGYTLE